MKFGIQLPTFGQDVTREAILSVAGRAETLGFDSVWLNDHVVFPSEIHSRYPFSRTGKLAVATDTPIVEPITTAGVVAGATSSVEIGFSVLVVPYRNPVVTAKQLASLDVLSKGRLVVGCGIGWLEEEFKALGADYTARAAITEEYIHIFKELWTSEDPVFAGKHYTIRDIRFAPKPYRKPHPPILVGGVSRAACRRVACLADGWDAYGVRPDGLRAGLEAIREEADQVGRDLREFEVVLHRPLEFVAERKGVFFGPPESVAEDIGAYAAAGATHIAFAYPWEYGAERISELMERFDREVRSKL